MGRYHGDLVVIGVDVLLHRRSLRRQARPVVRPVLRGKGLRDIERASRGGRPRHGRPAFETLTGAALERLANRIEDAGGDELDVDLDDGVLTVETGSGVQFLINRHAANWSWTMKMFMGVAVLAMALLIGGAGSVKAGLGEWTVRSSTNEFTDVEHHAETCFTDHPPAHRFSVFVGRSTDRRGVIDYPAWLVLTI